MPIPPPTSDDLSRDVFLVGLRCNGYKRIDASLIKELLNHPVAQYVQAGAHAVAAAPSPELITLLIETYQRRRQASLDSKLPDASLHSILASLSALEQELPELYLDAAMDTEDQMLATFGIIALAQMQHPRTAEVARQLLTDPRESVRSTAAGILARVAPDTAYDDLLKDLKNPKHDAKTLAPTISALLSTNHPTAVASAYEHLANQLDDVKVACAYDLAIRRPRGAGQLVVQLYKEMKSGTHRIAMLKAMGTLGDSDAQSCMFDALRRGSSAEAIAVVDRLAGYEPRTGWHDELRAAAKQRGEAAIIARIEERINEAEDRNEMR